MKVHYFVFKATEDQKPLDENSLRAVTENPPEDNSADTHHFLVNTIRQIAATWGFSAIVLVDETFQHACFKKWPV